MPKNPKPGYPVPALELLSALTLLQQQIGADSNTSVISPASYTSNSRTKLRKSKSSKLNSQLPGDDVTGFQITGTAYQQPDVDTPSTTVMTYSTLFPKHIYPVFRFYSPVSRGYLSEHESSQMAVTLTKDPLSLTGAFSYTLKTYFLLTPNPVIYFTSDTHVISYTEVTGIGSQIPATHM
ncbi:unnamed protein product [Calicophoron daubneyi]|uniref:Uncharacterized protein n=1 Tax=Calicophoron daubneyi TaxID=300641 RepID=A0AAV2TCB8_CALDB